MTLDTLYKATAHTTAHNARYYVHISALPGCSAHTFQLCNGTVQC